jgi:RNA polymerase sigma-70 factor, ECF subfamily
LEAKHTASGPAIATPGKQKPFHFKNRFRTNICVSTIQIIISSFYKKWPHIAIDFLRQSRDPLCTKRFFMASGSKPPDDKNGVLVRRLREHDPEVMGDLYDLYGRLLYVLVVRIVRNPSVAEDLVQESFLRAWNRSAQLSEEYPAVGPWLVMIARHCALDYLKSSQAHFAQVSIDEVKPPVTTIDQDILASDRARLIEGAFRNLSENQKRVIQMAFYEGLSQTAIAERLHQPLGTVKGWARSALSRLKGKLDPHLVDLVARH